MGQMPPPAYVPFALKVPSVTTEKMFREEGRVPVGKSEIMINAYGAYNKKLPSLTLKRDFFGNQRRSDPDFTRLIGDDRFRENMNEAMYSMRDQGTMAPRNLPGPGAVKVVDQQIMLYDPYTETPSIRIPQFGNATNYPKEVPVAEKVPGDVAQGVPTNDRHRISGMSTDSKTAYSRYMSIIKGMQP